MDTTGILALIILSAGVIYLFYGLILAYHWVRFSASWAIATFSLGAYLVAGVYLLGLMSAAVITLV